MKPIKLILSISFLLFSMIAKSQIQGGICNWDNDKKAAVVLTFDDWSAGHYPVVVPELKARNLNATFFIISGNIYNWSEINTTASYGNEIANHSKTHPNLTNVNSLTDEITNAKTTLDANVKSQTVTTFDYPFGATNKTVIDFVRASGHIAARGVISPNNYNYNFATKDDDYFDTQAKEINGSTTVTTLNTEISKAITGGGLFTYMYHSVNSPTVVDNNYATVTQANFKLQLDALQSYADKVWITTYTQAIRYHRERKCATLTETQAPTGTSWKLNLTDTLSNNTIYNQPLFIKLKMNGINYTNITQNGSPVTIEAVKNDTIMFHAIPDKGIIILTAVPVNGITIASSSVSPSNVSNNTASLLTFSVSATATNTIGSVKIDLSSIGGNANTILTSTGNGIYTVQYQLTSGFKNGSYSLPVKVTDLANNTQTQSIKLEITAGTVINSATANPSSIYNNAATSVLFSVNATDDGAVSSVNLDLTSVGGGASVLMNADSNNNFTLNYNIAAGLSLASKSIAVKVTDNKGNITSSNISINVLASTTYLDIYTDASAMVCPNCIWAANGTIAEQSVAGAFEGAKDFVFNYNVASYYAGAGLNVANWSYAQAKDFSSYDSLQFSFNGPTQNSSSVLVTLVGAGKILSSQQSVSGSSTYKTVKIALKDFGTFDLTKIVEIDFSIGGVASGTGTLRIDNIRLTKQAKITTALNQNEVLENEISIFPQPFDNSTTISNTNNYTEVEILNINGNLLANYQINSSNITVGSELQSGIYILKLKSDKGIKTIKILKN